MMDEKPQQFEIVEKKICYDGCFRLSRYLVKHTLFAGGWTPNLVREVLERGQAVAVLPYDPVTDQVIMIEQFRPGPMVQGEYAWLWEIIAGIVEPNETYEAVAHREAKEEANCVLTELISICNFFVSPGSTSETTTLFCGKVDATKIGGLHGIKEEHEDIQVHVISFKKAMQMIEQGQIRFAPAVIGLQWLALHYDEVRKNWLNT